MNRKKDNANKRLLEILISVSTSNGGLIYLREFQDLPEYSAYKSLAERGLLDEEIRESYSLFTLTKEGKKYIKN